MLRRAPLNVLQKKVHLQFFYVFLSWAYVGVISKLWKGCCAESVAKFGNGAVEAAVEAAVHCRVPSTTCTGREFHYFRDQFTRHKKVPLKPFSSFFHLGRMPL